MVEERTRVSTLFSARKPESDLATCLFKDSFFEEKPIWVELCDQVRETVCPQKLPPLELTSEPIPVPDRMAMRTSPLAIGTATVANSGILAILLLIGLGSTIHRFSDPIRGDVFPIKDFKIFAPSRTATGGGGGGSNDLMDPVTGRTPKQEIAPVTSPQVQRFENPQLAMESAIAVPIAIELPDDPSLPNIGVHKSPNVSLASNGPGTRAGIGTGSDGGDGPGKGPGYRPGTNGGFGGSIYKAGIGGVSNPIPVITPEAEFSDEARRNKYQGVCVIQLVVDSRGFPQNTRVVRSLGMGLDQKALAAVQGYRFKPARKDGKPVAVLIDMEVNFRLF
jgi:TonB family protein